MSGPTRKNPLPGIGFIGSAATGGAVAIAVMPAITAAAARNRCGIRPHHLVSASRSVSPRIAMHAEFCRPSAHPCTKFRVHTVQGCALASGRRRLAHPWCFVLLLSDSRDARTRVHAHGPPACRRRRSRWSAPRAESTTPSVANSPKASVAALKRCPAGGSAIPFTATTTSGPALVAIPYSSNRARRAPELLTVK